MITREMKRDWLDNAKEMRMRFVVVVGEGKEERHDHVDYCADEAGMIRCLQRLRMSRKRGGGHHFAPQHVLDVTADWTSQVNAERAWASAVPARLRDL